MTLPTNWQRRESYNCFLGEHLRWNKSRCIFHGPLLSWTGYVNSSVPVASQWLWLLLTSNNSCKWASINDVDSFLRFFETSSLPLFNRLIYYQCSAEWCTIIIYFWIIPSLPYLVDVNYGCPRNQTFQRAIASNQCK